MGRTTVSKSPAVADTGRSIALMVNQQRHRCRSAARVLVMSHPSFDVMISESVGVSHRIKMRWAGRREHLLRQRQRAMRFDGDADIERFRFDFGYSSNDFYPRV
jgi:hypothetical protein